MERANCQDICISESTATPTSSDATSMTSPEKESAKMGSKRRCGFNQMTVLIFSILSGGAAGGLLGALGADPQSAWSLLGLPGQLWLKSLKCVVLPLIIFSMIKAMITLRQLPGSRKTVLAVLLMYQFTTIVAAIEGCMVSGFFMAPLLGDDAVVAVAFSSSSSEQTFIQKERSLLESITGTIDNIVPKNVVSDAAADNLLPVIFASILFGLLIPAKQENGSTSTTLRVVDEAQCVVNRIVTGLMWLSPLGVGSLVLQSSMSLKLSDVGSSVGILIVTTLLGLAVHILVFCPLVLALLGRRNPFKYYRNCLPAFVTALGTASSAATLPVSMICASKNRIPSHLRNFVLSLGATINMDGAGVYLITATYFLATIQGIHLGFSQMVLIGLLSTVCSMGSAPIPSAGLVFLATIISAANIPLNSTFSLVVAVDWMLDRACTVVNVCSDLTIVATVAKLVPDAGSEVSIDEENPKGVDV